MSSCFDTGQPVLDPTPAWEPLIPVSRVLMLKQVKLWILLTL